MSGRTPCAPIFAVYCVGFAAFLTVTTAIGPALGVGIMIGASGVGLVAALAQWFVRTVRMPRRSPSPEEVAP